METAEQCVKSVKVNGKDTGTTSLTLFSVSMWYVCMCVCVCSFIFILRPLLFPFRGSRTWAYF